MRSDTLQIACPRSPRACIPPALAGILWLRIRSRRQLSIAFCSRSLNYTDSQGFLRSSVQGSSNVPPSLLCHRAETRSAWEAFFPARSCQRRRGTTYDPHTQLSLTSYSQVPAHPKRAEQPVTADITRPPHTDVRRIHPASSSEPQQMLLDPSPFLDVSTSAWSTSFVFDPNTVSWRLSASIETSYALQKSHDTPIERLQTANWYFLFLTLGGSLPCTLPRDPCRLLVRGPFRACQSETCCIHSDILWAQCRFHRAGLSSFSDRYFCQSSDRSLHTWSSRSDRKSLYCHSLAQTEVSMQTHCSAFISSRENNSATMVTMPSIFALEHTAPKTADLHLPPVCRIPLSWSTRSIRSVLPHLLCLQSLCPNSGSLCPCSASFATA